MKAPFAFCILMYCLLSAAYPQNLDIDLLHSINSGNSASWDNTNKVFSRSMMPVSIAAPVGFFLYGLLAQDSAAKRNSMVIGAGLLMSGIITIGMKYSFNRPRPFMTYPFIIKKGEGGGPSFPSGHTSSAFATATSLSLCYPKWYVIVPSCLWASAVGYSRMALGVHYPSDVLVGAIIGVGSSLLMWKANKQIADNR
ncbi:MAG: phosphatase PAP2 family protein [Bacteroidetes bacterium]|nr:MAG: phosphatase PAP2 family protein [Bacteroidota bacterium]